LDKGLDALFTAARNAYFGERKFIDKRKFDARTAKVLLLLLLARVDGKSPVEYLPPEKQDKVRRFVLPQLSRSDITLTEIQHSWSHL
jgi:hypothetical protein